MPAEELVPAAERARRAAVTEAARLADAESMTAGWLRAEEMPCASCGEKGGVDYMAASGTRDIRKAEVWGTSNSDDTIYRFRCTRCGHTWTGHELVGI
jgi:hypothetical protein